MKSYDNSLLHDDTTTLGSYAFTGHVTISKFDVPTRITSIKDRVFHQCKSIKEIIIPSSVTNIGSSCFYGATSLHTATLNSPYLGEQMFENAYGLKNVIFNCSPTTFPVKLFYNATGLETIDIPETVTSIGTSCFHLCKNLSEIKS